MSFSQISTKVCIVGASPAGLLIANILQKNRIPCILIEQDSYSAIYARSGFNLIDHSTFSILHRHGLSDRLIKAGLPQSKCEFRTPETSFILDYAQKCQGQIHYAYSKAELLTDLINRFEQTEGRILFNTKGIAITNNNHGAQVKCQQDGSTITINCDFIAGCDGFHGVAHSSIPESIMQPRHKQFDYAWLKITAEATASNEHMIYGLHPHGFAGYMPGNEEVSHYYLQISLKDQVAHWSDQRIWSELKLRLAQDNLNLIEPKIIAKQILQLEHFTAQTIQHCRLFLAGNSAHKITPAGEKELNLAIQDADALGHALVSYYRYHDNSLLKNYSLNQVPIIRQMQQFTESLLHMINMQNDQTVAGKSQQRVQNFKRSQLMNSAIYALDFARKYVGYLKGDHAQTTLIKTKKSTNVIKFNPAQLPPLKVG